MKVIAITGIMWISYYDSGLLSMLCPLLDTRDASGLVDCHDTPVEMAINDYRR